MREQLRGLHKLAGSPSVAQLKKYADAAGHSVGRSTLATVTTDGTSEPRWATVQAFIDACAGFASARRRPLQASEVDILVWRERYDNAYPDQRKDPLPVAPQRVRVVGLVPGLADCFQTRALVDELAHAVDDGGTTVLTGSTSARPGASTRLLSGMGGVGKTQLAIHLANHLRDTGQLDLLVWISATSRQTITAGFAQAAIDLSLPGTAGSDTDRDAARFHAWLTTTDQRWLVVLDDLRTASDLKELWPPIQPTGRTVVTSRLRGSALTGPGRQLVLVGGFTAEEATAYLRARLTSHPHLADDIDGLADALYQLPLALAHATAYLIDEDISCTEYQRRLAERGRRLDELAPPAEELPDDYTRTVAATVSISALVADQARPARLAGPLLRLASLLSPAGIPTSVFTTTAARNWLAYARAAAVDETGDIADLDAATIRSALQVLHRLSLITITGATVTVHGLVQRVTRDTVPVDHLADLAWAAADTLIAAWPTVERDPTLGQLLRDNTTAIRQHAGDTLLSPYTHAVLHRAGRSLSEVGDPGGAATAAEKLLADQVRVLGPDHPDTLSTRNDLAGWRGEAGDPAGAVAALEELLADQVRVLGPDHPDTLSTRNDLAGWRAEAGDPAGAVAAFEELLSDRLRALGPDHPDTLVIRSNLARSRGQAGDPAGAAAATEELLADQLRVLGADHPSTLTTRSNLAEWRGLAGDPAGAAAATEELLADQLPVLGPDHPSTLITRSNLAAWRGEAGDPAGAVAAYEELLADQLRVLGPDHPSTLTTRSNLADWRGRAGDLDGAVAALEELLADQLRVLGPDHPGTLTTRSNLAILLGQAGDPVGAVTAYEVLLADRLRVLGPDHPSTLTARNNLAAWRGAAGDTAGAAADFEDLLGAMLRVFGPDHPSTLTARSNLAAWRSEAGDPAGAAAAAEELLADQLRVLGPDHPGTLSTRNVLAIWKGQAGDTAGAAADFEDLLGAMLRVFGPDHPGTLSTRNNLAAWRSEAGDPAGAAAAAEELLADQLRVLGPDHPNTLHTRSRLAIWQGEAGDGASAVAALEDLLGAMLRVFGPDHPGTLSTRNNLAIRKGQAGDPASAATAFEDLLADHLRVFGPDHPATLITRTNLAAWHGQASNPTDGDDI